jgi:metallophosphoesterase (TIGR00282 family)
MNILFIGDIFGSPGRRIVADHLHDIVETNHIDLSIANAENSAGGFGLTPALAEDLLALGLDVLTSGNHIWDKREIAEYLDRQPRVLRPANYPAGTGKGVFVFRAKSGAECAIINLQGRVYMPNIDCPFRKADQILRELDPAVKVRFVDFHAEVTSEKMAMGWHLDGRVSAMVGTHTHIATADTRILPGGTAYQTDCGMTGPYESVIGVETDIVLQRFLTGIPVRMEAAKGRPELHAVIVDVDESTGKARSIRRHAINGD